MPEEAREVKGFPLQLELQAVVSHMIWVLRTELQPSAKSVHSLSHRAISPVLAHLFFEGNLTVPVEA